MTLQANTFSIVANCQKSGQLGIAISTALPGVGGLCPFICPNVGAVSTQSWVNPYLAIDIIECLKNGNSASEALEQVIDADEERDLRQLGIVDASGNAVSWTGNKCTSWAGQISKPGVAIQGNMLKSEATLEAMQMAFDHTTGALSERLLSALEAGQEAGGDKRGKQSAALKVFGVEEYPLVDLRSDEHTEPIEELRRIVAISNIQLAPFIAGMPSRNKKRVLDEAVKSMLLLPPNQR